MPPFENAPNAWASGFAHRTASPSPSTPLNACPDRDVLHRTRGRHTGTGLEPKQTVTSCRHNAFPDVGAGVDGRETRPEMPSAGGFARHGAMRRFLFDSDGVLRPIVLIAVPVAVLALAS